MRGVLLLSFLYLFTFSAFSQTGSASSPFTNLGNAKTVTVPGIYYFNLGGTEFSSYVNNVGMVLVATDFGGATGNLPQVTALSNSGRGILSSAVLATLTSASTAVYTTSDGAINASNSNSTILGRIVTNATLHTGINDVTINAGWTGTGNAFPKGASSNCASASGSTLDANIHHPCGDGASFHWIPAGNIHAITYNSGEAAGTVQFNLWVEAPLVALPVTLSAFKAVLLSDKTVQLEWTAETEINSAYFMVERSSDAIQWSPIVKINAINNSSRATTYSAKDNKPGAGNNFYRLKIVDLDGSVEFSKTVPLSLSTTNNVPATIFPNPGKNQVYISLDHPGSIKIFTLNGIDITDKIKISKSGTRLYSMDFSKVTKGMYIIRGDHFSSKIMIE